MGRFEETYSADAFRPAYTTCVQMFKRWVLRVSTLLPLLALTACWKLDDPIVDYSSVAFGNAHVESSTYVVEGFPTGLECPNGDEAYFYALYDPEVTEPQGVAIVYHSGAFDYVLHPVAGAPMAGPSPRAAPSTGSAPAAQGL